MKSIVQLINERPGFKDRILELAEIGRNQHEVVANRIAAYAEISDLLTIVQISQLKERPIAEPKYEYQWVRGARVKVRVN